MYSLCIYIIRIVLDIYICIYVYNQQLKSLFVIIDQCTVQKILFSADRPQTAVINVLSQGSSFKLTQNAFNKYTFGRTVFVCQSDSQSQRGLCLPFGLVPSPREEVTCSLGTFIPGVSSNYFSFFFPLTSMTPLLWRGLLLLQHISERAVLSFLQLQVGSQPQGQSLKVMAKFFLQVESGAYL